MEIHRVRSLTREGPAICIERVDRMICAKRIVSLKARPNQVQGSGRYNSNQARAAQYCRDQIVAHSLVWHHLDRWKNVRRYVPRETFL